MRPLVRHSRQPPLFWSCRVMKAWIALYSIFTSVQSAHLIENNQRKNRKKEGVAEHNPYSADLDEAK